MQKTILIEPAALKAGLSLHRYCDTESSRYALGGVSFEADGENVYCVATDSRRLAVREVAKAHGDTFSVVIPKKDAQAVADAIGATARRPVAVEIDGDTVRFKWRNERGKVKDKSHECKVIEGRFPRWRDVIPGKWNKPIGTVTGRAEALRAILPDDRGFSLDLNGHVKASRQTLTADAREVEYIGKPLTISFDLYLFGQWLYQQPDSAEVRMTVFDETAAAVLESGAERYVIMPICNDR